ncbi:pseudouridine-5'-phosphatase-like [Brevipalpus obovatus]|uniref:pseudouridine-5'-phosphatase-like n=1 Tax=Brevipalpus obovatus TaxID=246614 RepID=UPI003D9E5482
MSTCKFKPVTHVLFDLDGLLLDTETLYSKATNVLAARYGKVYTMKEKVKVMGKTGLDAARSIVELCGLPITAEQYQQEMEPIFQEVFSNVDFMPGARRLIRHLHQHKIPMAIATSSGTKNYEIKTKKYPEIFKSGKYFHHIVVASGDPEITHGKPHPQTFLVCAKRFDPPVDPSKALVFEDSVNGVKGAIAAGMQCVQVPDPELLQYESAEPTLVIDSLLNFKPELFGLPEFDSNCPDELP